jgi:hypothetical protein
MARLRGQAFVRFMRLAKLRKKNKKGKMKSTMLM